MKLESLKENKFKGSVLKREQMFTLNGGGTPTPAGHACGTNNVYPFQTVSYDYSYDSNRDGVITFHGRTNMKEISKEVCLAGQAAYGG